MVPQPRILVLSDKESIVERVRSVGPDAGVIGIRCLREPVAAGRESLLVIDPGAVLPCCFGALREWSRNGAARQLLYLTLPAPPSILFALPQVHPGKITNLDRVGAFLRRDHPGTPKRSAWRDVGQLAIPRSGDDRQERFLKLARARHRPKMTITQVAEALDVGSRQLTQLVWKWFGRSPRVILDLFRVECMARDLRLSAMKLKDLAFMHGYASRRTMSRQFRAYTGVAPETYRLSFREASVGRGRCAPGRGAASAGASRARIVLTEGDSLSARAGGEDTRSHGEAARKPGVLPRLIPQT